MAAIDLWEIGRSHYHLARQCRGVETRRQLAFQCRGGYRGVIIHQRRRGDSQLLLDIYLGDTAADIIGRIISPTVDDLGGRHLRVGVGQP